MLEELDEAFLNGLVRFWAHILTFFLSESSENTESLAGATTVPARHSTDVPLMPNAGAQLLPEAGATQERTLEAVSCSPMLGRMGVWFTA
jgi:hypothetical protein